MGPGGDAPNPMAHTHQKGKRPFLMECAHCEKSLLVRGYDLEDAATRVLVHGWRAFADNVLHCARCDGRERQQVCEHWTPQRKPRLRRSEA